MQNFLLLALAPAAVFATSCTIFDATSNLYVFGGSGGDIKAGPSSSWTSSAAFSTLPAGTGRPPFDGDDTQCLLNQYENGMVVFNGDKANPGVVHMYDFVNGAWSTQQTSTAPDLSGAACSLDHDTNTLYCYTPSDESLWFLGLDNTTPNATSATIAWTQSNSPSTAFTTSGYKPTVGAANNHLHFIGAGSETAGQAQIFVIHFAYWQPTPQTYASANGGTNFPASHGKTASFPVEANTIPVVFAFVPDDNSGTFAVNTVENSTAVFAAPKVSDAASSYTASVSTLVQLTSSNQLWYLDITQSSPAWTQISNSALTSSSNATSSSSTSNSGSSSASATASKSGSSSGRPSSSSAAASSTQPSSGAGLTVLCYATILCVLLAALVQ